MGDKNESRYVRVFAELMKQDMKEYKPDVEKLKQIYCIINGKYDMYVKQNL